MKILCTGDLHLGAHPEYGRAPGDRLAVQQDVLGRILGIACERGVDAILNVGDTFDGPGIPPEQLDVYARFIEAAKTVEMPIVAITGNGKHDAAMRTVNGMQIFAHIGGITVASTPRLVEVGDVTVACLPWVSPARLVAAENGSVDRDQVNQRAAELLVATARGLRPVIHDDRTAVLALHGSVSGTSLPSGLPVDDLREPVLDVLALEAVGFDYIVAGHIHKAQEIGSTGFYVGSPLPLSFGEDPDPYAHGVWILDTDEPEVVDAKGAEFVPVASPRFVTLDLDADQLAADVVENLHEVPDGAIVRVRYTATREQQGFIDGAHVRQSILDAGAAVVKVVPEIIRADRARVAGVTEDLAPLDAFDMWLEHNGYAAGGIDEQHERLRARAALYLESVPS